MKKIAISLPDQQADAVERIRRQRGIPRSRVIQEAIRFYLAEAGRDDAVRDYVEGYRRVPELEEAAGYARAAAETLKREDWS